MAQVEWWWCRATSPLSSLGWPSSKRKIMEVIEVDQLEDTNNERLRWAMPHSGLKPIIMTQKRKTTFDGRRPLTEDYLWWKTTFDGRWPMTEDDLSRKTTFDERQPSREDDLWWKTTFDGRRPSIGLQYITWKKYFRLLTLTATAQQIVNRKSYQLFKPEIEFHVMEEKYAALCICACAKKMTFVGKDD